MLRKRRPIGVVLAGGRGRRMGGSKLGIPLGGKPLIEYPLSAMRLVLPEVAVIAKSDVVLPPLRGVMLWIEPQEPQHPLLGVVEALAIAGGRPIVVCPADLPFVTPALLKALGEARPEGAPAVIATSRERQQPLLGCYQPGAALLLADAARAGVASVREAVAAIGPRLFEVEDPDELFNVNSPEDLLVAGAMLASRR
jgi:molybdopterin-guanine dinucleotide biosynthesis protein A